MKTNITIEEVRRINLRQLIEESEDGTALALAKKCGTAASYLSSILIRYKTESGNIREMGSRLARKLEEGCDKPKGWMDILHSDDAAPDADEDELRQLYLAMDRKTRSVLIEQAKLLSQLSKK